MHHQCLIHRLFTVIYLCSLPRRNDQPISFCVPADIINNQSGLLFVWVKHLGPSSSSSTSCFSWVELLSSSEVNLSWWRLSPGPTCQKSINRKNTFVSRPSTQTRTQQLLGGLEGHGTTWNSLTANHWQRNISTNAKVFTAQRFHWWTVELNFLHTASTLVGGWPVACGTRESEQPFDPAVGGLLQNKPHEAPSWPCKHHVFSCMVSYTWMERK